MSSILSFKTLSMCIPSLNCYSTYSTGAVKKIRACKEQVANEYSIQ